MNNQPHGLGVKKSDLENKSGINDMNNMNDIVGIIGIIGIITTIFGLRSAVIRIILCSNVLCLYRSARLVHTSHITHQISQPFFCCAGRPCVMVFQRASRLSEISQLTRRHEVC